MKTVIYFALIVSLLLGCNSPNKALQNMDHTTNITEQDTVRIANDNIEYEIIIIEPGFNSWLLTTAKPEGYYSQEFMETRNWQYVLEWNNRVLQPHRYSPNLYGMQIDYDRGVDYGYEVNYKLYNYFIYFQLTYNQRLAGYVPRI
jgi:hypothetical protein